MVMPNESDWSTILSDSLSLRPPQPLKGVTHDNMIMYRIDTTNTREKWRWACPSPKRHANWRVTDGMFECRSCGETYDELVNQETGERVPREKIEFVGPDADSKGQFGKPTVKGE